ncbi:hypothetical protein L1887_30368 [Cichorium endivia]|nr:hypothetical protein L1887_30368 [Cichorium endivia]
MGHTCFGLYRQVRLLLPSEVRFTAEFQFKVTEGFVILGSPTSKFPKPNKLIWKTKPRKEGSSCGDDDESQSKPSSYSCSSTSVKALIVYPLTDDSSASTPLYGVSSMSDAESFILPPS